MKIFLATLLFALGASVCVAAEKKEASFEGRKDTFEYSRSEGHPLTLDLYRPKESKGEVPVIVFVHGGGWKNGSKDSGRKRGAWIVEHGFALASIEQRKTDIAQWPSQINDCYEAVRWLRRNAKELGLKSDKIGAWGTSSGGHLAALMGTRAFTGEETTSSRVQAVCDWFGPTDLLTMPPNNVGSGRTAEDVANSNGAKLLGATVREVPRLAKDASAFYQASAGDAAFLIMHGDEDPGVPLEQSVKLHQQLVKCGVPSTLEILKGAGHGGPEFALPESHEAVRRFFEATLK